MRRHCVYSLRLLLPTFLLIVSAQYSSSLYSQHGSCGCFVTGNDANLREVQQAVFQEQIKVRAGRGGGRGAVLP
jgi:hypothetical protein